MPRTRLALESRAFREDVAVIVWISRELGAGGGTVGEALAKALDATLLNERSIIAELTKREGFSSDYLEHAIERPPTLGQSLTTDLARASAMLPIGTPWRLPEETIIESVRDLIIEHAATGNLVVIGFGGVSMLGGRSPGVRIVRLLLHAGRTWRIEQLSRRFGIGLEAARRHIDETDDARVRYQRHYFNSDLYDCRQYDLILNTETLGFDLAIDLAKKAVRAA